MFQIYSAKIKVILLILIFWACLSVQTKTLVQQEIIVAFDKHLVTRRAQIHFQRANNPLEY